VAVKPIPEGYHSITPYLVVEGAAKLIDFLKEAFDAQTRACMFRLDGKVGHAELQIGDSVVMVADTPEPGTSTNSTMYLYVPNVDEVYQRALAVGGTSIAEPADQFYGDRHGGVKDPTGNSWWIATHVEDVSPEEMKRRSEEWAKKKQSKN
jgi:PhnB protein